MTSASSPEPNPDLQLEMQPERQPELQPAPVKPAPELEFEPELETALPALDVIPHPAPVVAPTIAVDTETVVSAPVATPEAAAADVAPSVAADSVAADTASASNPDDSSLTDKLVANFFKLWARAVGEPADPNRAIIGLSVLSLTTLLVLSRIYGFIDQLPVLAPVFELVGFFYSISLVIKYIRSAEDRSNLTQTVDDVKKKLLG